MKEKTTIFELIAKPSNKWTNKQIIDFVKNNPKKSWSTYCFVLKRSKKEIQNILQERNHESLC